MNLVMIHKNHLVLWVWALLEIVHDTNHAATIKKRLLTIISVMIFNNATSLLLQLNDCGKVVGRSGSSSCCECTMNQQQLLSFRKLLSLLSNLSAQHELEPFRYCQEIIFKNLGTSYNCDNFIICTIYVFLYVEGSHVTMKLFYMQIKDLRNRVSK